MVEDLKFVTDHFTTKEPKVDIAIAWKEKTSEESYEDTIA